jgi:glycosyltransferase involved in cell wall biosynthesis
MTDNPRATIISSIYNGEKFLDQFLQNVLSQNCIEEIEVFLLDANSTDSTAEIISNYQHDNIFYKKLPERKSVTDTLNMGIGKANSEILTIWNIDDRRSNLSLKKQVEYMENNPECDICYGYAAWSFKENESFEDNNLKDIYPCEIVTPESMMKNNSPHCLPVWRKNIHSKFGYFDKSYPTASDYDFWLRCLTGGARFDKIYEIIGSYYYNPRGLSTCGSSTNQKESEEIKQKYTTLWSNEKRNS